MRREIVLIYENIYNQELNMKNNLDNKFASRLTIVVALTTATFLIFSTLFFPNVVNAATPTSMLSQVSKVLSILSILHIVLIYFSFYKSFFRWKLNYMVMPTVDIRLFHFYIHRNHLLGTKDEDDLYDYLNDSYQFCAYTNASINSKREHALILFDNLVSYSFVLLIVTYIMMMLCGYSINWIF